MAAIYDIVIGIAIYRYKHTIAEGLIVLYFSVCATSYHVGISAMGAPTCSCLGVANVWLSNGVIDELVKVLLALFWIYGIALVRTHYRVRRANLSAATALVIGLSALSNANVSANESPLSIKATLASERLTRKGTYTKRIDTIHASFDSRAMLITTFYDRSGPKSEEGPCTNYVYLTKEVFAGFLRCKDLDTSVAEIADAKYAWALGNCESITDTFTFLAVRSSELFPNARGGTRPRLSLTVHPIGLHEPISQIPQEGHFSNTL